MPHLPVAPASMQATMFSLSTHFTRFMRAVLTTIVTRFSPCGTATPPVTLCTNKMQKRAA